MRTLITLFSLLVFPSFAYAPLDSLPYGSRHTLLVSDSMGNHSIQLASEQFFPPASTLKIATALAAKLELGDDFRFETHLEIQEKDLVIRFSGDPELKTEHLSTLITNLKAQGINRLENVILDNSAFRGYERAVGWPWDILGVCYSAPASAITLDNNCVQASISSKPNQATSVFVPVHQPIKVTTDALSLSKIAQKSKRCDLELLTSEGNQYHLSGCMQERSKPLPLKFAVQDTTLYVSAIIKRILAENGIQVSGKIYADNVASKGIIVATHQSAPLPELLTIMLRKSDNLIADNLTKTLGARFYHQPGSFSNGTEAIKQILFTRAGIDLEHAKLEDGSGLSRNNRLTSSDMEKILRHIWKYDVKLGLIELLPISGQSGTLKYRQSMRKPPIAGKLAAKSGSLYGSYNMAGFVLDESNKPRALFVQFITDYHPVKKDDAPKVIAPIFHFEQQFYKDLVNSTLKND
ncbi:putative D-alanyl-D-alanine carboxypeptidase [Vibrio nigripulchritudo MADA3029]|uniref:serine-type D-Ala-D-Ala carboxypeptidase n=1 Tax=Vibrio nigripulchritudo TaxID=28173 RepID=UPI0003B1A602|nr:serine-type D-Ala-D-Ala carboxypeptidase [Vibrio nigripulchritudo]CCN45219.1 putative D-alanyl-D-alanine carboxypeptidase [Vibrio nigripulchritudo MADA3020]CCN53978.1 putative D-alanyl-D-alanine carboxypeptidase [Vibrio nigripulchritudo MADA3021]CCN57607.1 putative D-alanyl-D-alanine carboxypeptidase [Vibrio nigripulchritudo MADA3029]